MVRWLMLLSTMLVAACGADLGSTGGPTPDAMDVSPEVIGDGAETVVGSCNRPGTPGSYRDPLERLQKIAIMTPAKILDVRARPDGRVLACTGRGGLKVIDATDPSRMVLAATLSPVVSGRPSPTCQNVAYDGDIVYVAHRGDGFIATAFVAAFDLSRSPPAQVATFTSAGRSFEGIAAAGGFVYTVMKPDGLVVLEHTGGTLVERGIAAGLSNGWGVDVVGSTVYVADGPTGLAVVDATNPDAPAIVGRVATGGAAQAVSVDGTVAFVAAGSAGLVVVDVADPRAPVVLSSGDTDGTALKIALSNGHAFVANFSDARVFDVRNPSAPQLVATERIPNNDLDEWVMSIGARDGVAFVGTFILGFYSLRYTPDLAAPDLSVATYKIDFGIVAPGDLDAYGLIVGNEGTAPLAISSVEVQGAAFSVDAIGCTLAPGERQVFEVLYRPSSTAADNGTLTLHSDDPDEPARVISLVGNVPGLGICDPAPDVVVSLLGGGTWRLSEHRGQVVVLAYFATW